MPFKYRAITANCGNDVIGKKASEQIAERMHEDDADFYVINCQEVSFESTKRQLQKAVGEGYTVVCLKNMTTHTKLSTQFHSGTGIATFVIHKNNLANLMTLCENCHEQIHKKGSKLKRVKTTKGVKLLNV